jgi:hypothetical protein
MKNPIYTTWQSAICSLQMAAMFKTLINLSSLKKYKSHSVRAVSLAEDTLSVRLAKVILILVLVANCQLPTANLMAQCTSLECNQNVTLALKNDCKGSINSYFLLANPLACGGPSTMEYYDQDGNFLGDTLNESHLGMTVDAYIHHTWTGLSCVGTVNVVDGRPPEIDCENYNLKCTEDYSVATLGMPIATDNCSSVASLSHEDEIIDLGCGMQGFQGYFDPSNWVVTAANGDGGVDVTGAPNAVLVEGANSSPFRTSPRYITRIKTVIPSEGYISFDWSSFGGSNFTGDAFFVTINGVCIQLSFNDVQNGSWQSWLLQPGDVLSFEQASDGNNDMVTTEISNFRFITTAQKIIHRTWTATDDWGNKGTCLQVITLERATLAEVNMPANFDDIQQPSLTCGAGYDPSITGYPFLDDDGDLNTTFDQYAIQNGDCTFSMTYEDQSIITCEGSELILREWRILDDCTSQIFEEIQIIKIFDQEPPTLTCPPNMTVGTTTPECGVTIQIPSINAFDDCASTVNLTPNWSFGNGFGPFDDVPPGTYPINVEAADPCGNSTSCTMLVTVEDQHPPTVICDGFTVASLTPDGTALIFATSIDDGSYDLCCLDNFEIKRKNEDDSAYGEFLHVDCSDAGTSFMVHMRANDCAGNAAYCEVELMVEDEQAPALLAPADVTVDCNVDLSDLSIYGDINAVDNCGLTIEEFTEEITNGCGQGAVVRTWVATDNFGNTNTVTQNINIYPQSPWNANNDLIVWPVDYTTNDCNAQIAPDQLTAPFNVPTYNSVSSCQSVSASYDDELFWVSEPSCYFIYRTWTVIDFCQWSSNSTDDIGKWEYVQVITVNDDTAPLFVNAPVHLEVPMTSISNCTATVSLPTPTMFDCSDHIALSAQGDLGFGFNFSNVSAGIYNMTYTASDGCGNTSSHNFTVEVLDNNAPTALCVNGMTVDLNSSGDYTVSANSLNLASFDNCSDASTLQYSFSLDTNDKIRTYTCNNLGQNNLELYVTDANGNQSSCSTWIKIEDSFGHCLQNPDVISGFIRTTWDEGIAQVNVHPDGMNMTSSFTSNSGDFEFSGDLQGYSMTIRPEKNINILNGVTTFDLAKMNDHILGKEYLDSPYKMIAADANNSGTITVGDLVVVQKVILHLETTFPNTPSWRFVPADFIFPNPNNPWETPFPESIELTNILGDMSNVDFIGIKIGDVTENAIPSNLTGNDTDDRSADKVIFAAENRRYEANEIIEITFSNDNFNQLLAWQMTIEFDQEKLEFLRAREADFWKGFDLTKINSPKFGEAKINEGALTALWLNHNHSELPKQADLFTLTFKTKSSLLLSEVLNISSRFTPAIAYNKDESNADIEFEFIDNELINDEKPVLSLEQNYPNPFSDKTQISFTLPESNTAILSFYNVSGKVLFEITQHFEKGKNSVEIAQSDLPTSTGVVFYRLNVDGEILTKRMVLTR